MCITKSYVVTQRQNEIGIRMALGATQRRVLAMILVEGLKLTLFGVVIGTISAFALTRFMSTILYGVSPADPLTFTSIAMLLVLMALLACYLPARRATRIDPMIALRYQ